MANIYLVHAATDRALARFLKSEIESRLGGAVVFVAWHPGQIPTGADWLAEIQEHLRNADCFVVLLTERSLKRYWVWYESGAAWMSGRRVIPVAAPLLRREAIPYPLGARQTLSLDDPDDAAQLFRDLGTEPLDVGGFIERVRALAVAAEEAAAEEDGWHGVELAGRYFAWRGPLHSLDDRVPVQAPVGLEEALRATACIPCYGNPERLAHHLRRGRLQVFETDRRSWKRSVLQSAGDRAILLARPEASSDRQ
jgi:hypothetical protein